MHELHIFIGKGCKKKNTLLVWKFDKKIRILTFLYRNWIIGLKSRFPIFQSWSKFKWQLFLLQSFNFRFSSPLCCIFVCICVCVCVFLCVCVCNTCVCPLEFVGQFNSHVCLWLGSWLIRQTEASCKLKSVNNQRRHK